MCSNSRPLLWLQEFTSILLDLIHFFYVHVFVMLYRAEDEEKFSEFEATLLSIYELRSLGNLSWSLRIRIIRSDDRFYLCQDSYIEKFVENNSATTAWPHSKTPLSLDLLVDYDGVAIEELIYTYQQRIGSLTFAATITRPDISFITAKLAQYLTDPSPLHLQAVNRVLSYLHYTKQLAIEFSDAKTNPVLSSSNAAFADDQKTRESLFRYLIQLCGGPID